MKYTLLFSIALLAVATVNAEKITIDGTTYEDIRWGRVTPAAVSIFHKTGVASIPLEKLPYDLQQNFSYDPKKAADYRKAQAAIAVAKADADRKQAVEKQQNAEREREAAKLRPDCNAPRAFYCKVIQVTADGQFVSVRGECDSRDGHMYSTFPEPVTYFLTPRYADVTDDQFVKFWGSRIGTYEYAGSTVQAWGVCKMNAVWP